MPTKQPNASGAITVYGPTGLRVDRSVTITTTATNVFAAAVSGSPRVRMKVLNTDVVTPSGGAGIVIWYRWGTAAGAPAAAHGVGSFPLLPGGGFDDIGTVSQEAMNCIAESGSPVLFAEEY